MVPEGIKSKSRWMVSNIPEMNRSRAVRKSRYQKFYPTPKTRKVTVTCNDQIWEWQGLSP